MPTSYANPFQDPTVRRLIRQQPGGLDLLEPGTGDPRFGFALLLNLLRSPGQSYSAPRLFTDWLERQYDRMLADYGAMAAFDPGLSWIDYLASRNFGQEYGQLTPSQRGERPAVFAPRTRYVGF